MPNIPNPLAFALKDKKRNTVMTIAAFLLVLSAGAPAPCFAGNSYGPGIVGGVLGGILGNAVQQQQQQQRNYQLQQLQQQYYQQQQQLNYQRQQLELERQRQQAIRNQQQQEHRRQRATAVQAKQKQQDAARIHPSPEVTTQGNGSDTVVVRMKKDGGVFKVPVRVNNAVSIDFIIDSGASDVTIPADVVSTLLRSETLTKKDIVGEKVYRLADGSKKKEPVFKLQSVQVGDYILSGVVATSTSDAGDPLLGQSFLSHFASWTQDNGAGTLVLKLHGTGTSPDPTQTVAATPEPAVPGSAPAEETAANVGQPVQQVAATPASMTPTDPSQQQAPAAALATAAGASSAAAEPSKQQPATGGSISVAATAPEPAKPQVGAGAAEQSKPQAATAVASSGQSASAAKSDVTVPVFPKYTAYADARRRLMALGYAPAALPDVEKCDRATDKTCFPERDSCTGPGQCGFLWRREETLIMVGTVDNPPIVSAVECQVNCR
jgi:predicted aspartyl protease